MSRLSKKYKCGKCSANGKLPIGLTIIDPNSLLLKTILGLVKNDPYCFQCGTTFPDNSYENMRFWKESNGFVYRIKQQH